MKSTTLIKLSLLIVLCTTLFVSCDILTGGGGNNGGGVKEPCIPLNKQTLVYVPLDQYLKDVGRFNNEVSRGVNDKFINMATQYPEFAGKNPSRHVTFSLHRLKNFIYEIERLSEQEGVDVDSMGITWSFAIYDHDADHNGATDLRSQQTLYGMPSRLMPDGTYAPVDIYHDFSAMGRKAMTWVETGVDPIGDERTGILESDNAFNRGNLCPPICNDDMRTLQSTADSFSGATFGTLNRNQ